MKSLILAAVTAFVLISCGTILFTTGNNGVLLAQEDTTLVREGQITDKQKEHSKLYKQYSSNRNIPELLKTEKGDIELYRLLPLVAELEGSVPASPSEILRRITCNADAVVIAAVKSKSSQFTEDKTFVFTDYELTVLELLKNNSSTHLELNSEITFTRPGGSILFRGRKITALDESFQPLKIDKRYLLFLRLVPTTDAYKTIESGEGFELTGSKVRSIKGNPLDSFAQEYVPASLTNEVRAAVHNNCGRGGGVR